MLEICKAVNMYNYDKLEPWEGITLCNYVRHRYFLLQVAEAMAGMKQHKVELWIVCVKLYHYRRLEWWRTFNGRIIMSSCRT